MFIIRMNAWAMEHVVSITVERGSAGCVGNLMLMLKSITCHSSQKTPTSGLKMGRVKENISAGSFHAFRELQTCTFCSFIHE
jgi:hypothetical protein